MIQSRVEVSNSVTVQAFVFHIDGNGREDSRITVRILPEEFAYARDGNGDLTAAAKASLTVVLKARYEAAVLLRDQADLLERQKATEQRKINIVVTDSDLGIPSVAVAEGGEVVIDG